MKMTSPFVLTFAASSARAAGHHEWACFAAQQAAEKALKAVLLHLGARPTTHDMVDLLKPIVAKIKAGLRANGVAVHPDGKRVYVSNGGAANVSVIDTASNSPAGQSACQNFCQSCYIGHNVVILLRSAR